MIRLFKRTLNIIAVVMMLFAMNIVAFAEGTTTIDISKKTPAVGDSITVTVKATESGTVTVKYTSSLLKYSSCSVSGATASGNTVSFSGKEGDVVFEASANGTASIIVSSTNNAGSSATLTVGQAAAPAEEPKPQEPPKEEAAAPAEEPAAEPEPASEPAAQTTLPADTSGAAGTLREDGKFDIGGAVYVASERYKADEIPSGFNKQAIKIGASSYNELSNGTITLVYLKPEANTSGAGVFYIFDQASGTVSPFLMLGNADKYVIISASTDAPGTGFVDTTLDVTGGTAPAYTVDGSEFFYVNGTNQDGAQGWFVYDKTYGTISRVDQSTLGGVADGEITDSGEPKKDGSEKYASKLNLYRKIIMGLIALSVILLFIVINVTVKGRGDDFDGDIFAKAPTKSTGKHPRSIVFGSKFEDKSNNDDDEDDEDVFDEEDFDDDEQDFEDDYKDDYRDTSKSAIENDSYEARRDSSLHMMDLNDL